MPNGWAIAMLVAAPAQAVADDPAGTPIELMVMREVTGDRSAPGAEVKLTVNRALVVAGGTIPVGTPAFGEVVRTKASGMMLRRGAIAIKLTRLVIGGREVAIRGAYAAKGHGDDTDTLAKIMFVPIYALFAPGNVRKVKAGQIVEGRLPPGFTLEAKPTP